jgi:hypothetical protein
MWTSNTVDVSGRRPIRPNQFPSSLLGARRPTARSPSAGCQGVCLCLCGDQPTRWCDGLVDIACCQYRGDVDYIVMVMDQASWHKANALRIPENMSLVWQPPYSPQCNPVEHIWEEIREKWFPNLVFKNLDGVVDTLAGALATLENDWVRTQSITGFDWIVSLSLKAT